MKRGQYSLEFLLTYSWAFLVIGIALAAIYSFGWIQLDEVLPEKCEFYGQAYCQDFQALSEGLGASDKNVVDLVLVNRFGADLMLHSATIYDPANDFICGTDDVANHPDFIASPVDAIAWNNSQSINISFRDCHYSGFGGATKTLNWIPGDRIEATLNITFYNPETADPRNGEVPVYHSQLGALYVLVRKP